MPGTLSFRPIEANLSIKDKDLIGKMDPYCLFHVGGHRVKSQVAKNGGQNPHWQDVVSVEMPSTGGFVQVDLKDKDMLVDDKLGTFELDLNEVASLGQVRKWYPIFSHNKPAGEILLETTFNGSGLQQGFNQGMGQQRLVGVPVTQSTNYHPTTIPQQQYHGMPQQGSYIPQPTLQQSGQPLGFSGVQPTVIPVGGVSSGVEQYAIEALMRGVDPMNTQQHYHYNVANGSQNPGFSGIPMNYSSGVNGSNLAQYPQNLTQTPLYSGSQPLQYEGNAGHAETLSNTYTTGHHNPGFLSKMEQKEQRIDQKFGTHSHPVETKNYSTGDMHSHKHL